jgi:hypothetical protein
MGRCCVDLSYGVCCPGTGACDRGKKKSRFHKRRQILKSVFKYYIFSTDCAAYEYLSFYVLNNGRTLCKNISLRGYQNISLELYYMFDSYFGEYNTPDIFTCKTI